MKGFSLLHLITEQKVCFVLSKDFLPMKGFDLQPTDTIQDIDLSSEGALGNS